MVNTCRLRRFVYLAAALLPITFHTALTSAQTPPVRLLTTADGLVHSTVQRIRLDSRGFLWFATIMGVARFDGRHIVNYSMSDGLPDLVINDVYEDPRGAIWVSTNGGGLARFRAVAEPGELFDVIAVGATRRSNRVNKLLETADGRLWAVTDEGLFVARGADPAPAFVRIPLGAAVEPSVAVQVMDLTVESDGTMWLATSAGLLRRAADGRADVYQRPPNTGSALAYAVTLTPDHRVWVGFADGLGVWRKEDPKAERLLREVAGSRLEGVAVLRVDGDGAVLAGTNSGDLLRFHNGNARVLWRPTARGTQIYDLCVDRRSDLWIATADGVGRMMRTGLVMWQKPEDAGEVTFQQLMQRTPDEIFGMSHGGWIGRVKGDRLQLIQPRAIVGSFTDILTNQLPLVDREGHWWIGTNRGLYRFGAVPFEQLERAQPLAIYRIADGLPSDLIGRLFEDRQGDIWIATMAPGGEVLARWQRATNRIHTFAVGAGLEPRNVPIAFAEDRDGRVWVTFRDGGLARFSAGRFEPVSDANLGRSPVHAIHFDRRGRLWLAARGRGMLRVDDPSAVPWRIQRYSSSNGFLNEGVTVIVEDANGALYAGGQRGLERIDPETNAVQLVAPASVIGSTLAALVDGAGNMWMGGLVGIARLTLSAEQPVPPPIARIAAARIAGVPRALSPLGVEDAGTIELAASRNNLQFEFFGLDDRLESSLRYQSRLIGAGEEWSAPTSDPSLTYASLAPGRYRFEVRAVTTTGEVSARPAIATVIVHPPFWAQWWFRTAVVSGVFALAYAWYRYRLRHALALERVRSRIATDLHDDIGADLSQIAILSEVVRRDVSATHPQASNRLSSIAATASGLVDSMSDIVWAINPGRDSMPDLVHRMRRFVSDTLGARNIAFRFEAPADTDAVSLGADARRNVFLVLKEAVHNIVRHAHASSVDIRLERDGRWLTLAVRDDGVGFDPAQRASGTGLSSMRARVEALGGRLHIDSRPLGGTRVTLTVSCR